MVAGRHGMRLEGLKFAVYLGIPLVASCFFNEPETVRYFVDYFKFVEYPANPNTGFREQLEEQAMQRKQLMEQKEMYAKQLRDLEALGSKGRSEDEKKNGWWRPKWIFGSS